jgi:hypothetical protein
VLVDGIVGQLLDLKIVGSCGHLLLASQHGDRHQIWLEIGLKLAWKKKNVANAKTILAEISEELGVGLVT